MKNKKRTPHIKSSQSIIPSASDTLFIKLLEAAPDALVVVNQKGLIELVNTQAEKIFGYTREEILGKPVEILMPEGFRRSHKKRHAQYLAERQVRSIGARNDLVAMRKDGSVFPVDISLSPLETDEDVLIIAAVRDITERKHLEDLLQKATQQKTDLLEEQYRRIVETAEEGIWTIDPQHLTTFVNPKLAAMFGYTPKEMLGRSLFDFMDENSAEIARASLGRQQQGQGEKLDFKFRRKDGSELWAIVTANPILDESGQYIGALAMVTDITDRKKAEKELKETKELNERIIQTANVLFLQSDTEANVIKVNEAAEKITGYSAAELIGTNWGEKLVPRERFPRAWEEFDRIVKRGELPTVFENPILAKNGEEREILWNNSQLRENGKVVGLISFGMDISEKKIALEKLRESETQNRTLFLSAQQRLNQTLALRNIDNAINSSLDLKFTVEVLLTQTRDVLGVDAADILLYNSTTHVLNFFVGQGFRTDVLKRAPVPLGRDYAGKVVLDHNPIHVSGLSRLERDSQEYEFFQLEGFEDFNCLPLIAKGKVLGVLETFNRTSQNPNDEWLDYLTTLAGQAAIAIENITLFEGLQKANDHLVLGYDATIEGWSRALDLRDKETEGHTQRVTKRTLQLAADMGMNDEEQVHIRRGALLHDIGKMGVPDSILLKPGKLTDAEWDLMKKHPTFAFQLLSPIAYLKNALDIPYCHHEHWDGSGYPRGLKGEAIPITARIFAVVDVYDALTSDRPYRKAWSKEKTLEYIRSQAGSHFDPHIVKIFLEKGSSEE